MEGLIQLAIFAIIVIVSALVRMAKGNDEKPRRPRPARPRPRPQQAPIQQVQKQQVEDEVGAFLREAAGRGQARPARPTQSGAPRQTPQRRTPPPGATTVEAPVAMIVEAEVTTESPESAVSAAYLTDGTGTSAATDLSNRAVPATVGGQPRAAPLDLAALFANADSLRQAVILNEIFQRPEHRW